MTISKLQVENILKTLPLGYYIKRDVKVRLVDEDGSYYDMMNDEISISYPMIEKVCQSLPETDTLENDIRCLLYHEASHAFITPKKLRISSFMNVFEDERIESIFRKYYLGVKFREFVKRVNQFKGEKPMSGEQLYYQIVRYRIGPQQFLQRVSKLIKKYSHLTNNQCWNYYNEVYDLYIEICHYFNEQQNQSMQNSQSNSTSDTQNQSQSNQSQSSQDDSTEQDSQPDFDDIEDDSNQESFGKGEIEQLINESIGKFDSEELSQDVDKILSSVKHSSKMNGSAINAYSGVFDPRSVARQDYKYFVQQNRVGHVKAFSKIHLNLFIDCSGSFQSNDLTVNKFLKALHKFEKSNQDFSFDLISCGNGQRIRDKHDRIQNPSTGGTALTNDIFNQYKSLQNPGTQNINIVLYDGDASASTDPHGKNFSVFNNRNCILIVDPENERYVNNWCKNAKVVITTDYTKELKKHILEALQTLTR